MSLHAPSGLAKWGTFLVSAGNPNLQLFYPELLVFMFVYAFEFIAL